MSQDTDIDMLNNDTNNTHDINSKTRSKTSKAIGSKFTKFINSQNDKPNNSPQNEQYLLQSALVILSKTFKQGIDSINKEIKMKNQLYQM